MNFPVTKQFGWGSNADPFGTNGVAPWSAQEAQNLRKALEVGGPTTFSFGTVAPGNGAPLRIESLESVLAIASYREKHIKLLRMLRQMRAYNVTEFFNVLDEYGQQATSTVSDGGSLPSETDSTYHRGSVNIKYRATTRRIALPQLLTAQAHGPAINLETANGMKYMLRDIEKALFFGRDDLDSLEWQGLEQQIEATATSIEDKRGATFGQEDIENWATATGSEPNFGEPNLFLTAPQAHSQYSQSMNPRQRIDMNEASRMIVAGEVVTRQKTSMGDVMIDNDVFISAGPRVSTISGASTGDLGPSGKIPTGVTVTVAAAASVDASSQFGAGEGGNFYYWVIARNSDGRTVPVQVNGSALTVADGSIATFTIQPTVGPVPKSYEIFRTRQNDTIAGNARRIMRVPNVAAGGPTVITDVNAFLPGCVTSFMLSMKPEEITLKVLLPMVRIPLPPIDLYTRWAQAFFAAPAVRIGKHHRIVRNTFAEY